MIRSSQPINDILVSMILNATSHQVLHDLSPNLPLRYELSDTPKFVLESNRSKMKIDTDESPLKRDIHMYIEA